MASGVRAAVGAILIVLPVGRAHAQSPPGHEHTPAPLAAEHLHPAPGAAAMPAHDMSHMGHVMASTGAYGSHPPTREASGTSWQPDESIHEGIHSSAGGWDLMAHGMLNLVHSRQTGLRGDRKTFVAGWSMLAARRDFGAANTVNLRLMLTPEPLMKRRGYPLLLAVGETPDGVIPLRDRQHPHDLFMEMAASYSRRFSAKDSAFLYLGLPGDPALGPPAFMHRLSAMDSPEAPIGHHWMDSTHVTFGVVTAGLVHGSWKLEGSGFRGREPDQKRYDLESPRLDSASVRLSWNPTARLSLQASTAWLKSPEQLDPLTDERRSTASAIYTRKLGAAGFWSTTAAFARKTRRTPGLPSVTSNAWLVESAARTGFGVTFFGRAERVQSDELEDPVFPIVLPPVFLPPGFPIVRSATGEREPQAPLHIAGALPAVLRTVSKLSLGAVYDVRIAAHAKIGVGGLYSFIDTPRALDYAYGPRPSGAMAFARLVIN